MLKRDVILGVFANYGFQYPGIEQYMVSIERSGFSGRKVLLVWNLRPEVRAALLSRGWELIETLPPARETKTLPVNFFIHRIKVVADYLANHGHEFNDVFWLDIKDLIVQTNPSTWMTFRRAGAGIIASTECVTLEQEETNNKWILDVCGKAVHSWLKNEEVINGGTFAGESSLMTRVFNDTFEFIRDYKGEYPACQPGLNYILRTPGIVEELRIPRWVEGFAACLHPMWAQGAPSHPRDLVRPYLRDIPPALDVVKQRLYPQASIDRDLMSISYVDWHAPMDFKFRPTYNPRTGIPLIEADASHQPFCIVHGWDRDFAMKHFFEEAWSLPRLHGVTEVYRDYKNFLEGR